MKIMAIALLIAGLTLSDAKLYEQATAAVDDHEWTTAVALFRQVVAMRGEHADAALYWLAYSQSRSGHHSEALGRLAELRARYPKSRWTDDARALEVEIRQEAGMPVAPERVMDEDAKLIALASILESAPDRAVPMLTQIVIGREPVKRKERALFVLTQSDNPKAFEVLRRVARDRSAPQLQQCAVRFLGVVGGKENQKVLADIAKTEKVISIRIEAIRNLGLTGGNVTIYGTDRNAEVRRAVIDSLFLQRNAAALTKLARIEKDIVLKRDIVEKLAVMKTDE